MREINLSVSIYFRLLLLVIGSLTIRFIDSCGGYSNRYENIGKYRRPALLKQQGRTVTFHTAKGIGFPGGEAVSFRSEGL